MDDKQKECKEKIEAILKEYGFQLNVQQVVGLVPTPVAPEKEVKK